MFPAAGLFLHTVVSVSGVCALAEVDRHTNNRNVGNRHTDNFCRISLSFDGTSSSSMAFGVMVAAASRQLECSWSYDTIRLFDLSLELPYWPY